MKIHSSFLALGQALLLAAMLFACSKPGAVETSEGSTAPEQWTLPNALREASGLAIASPDYLLVHNDEKGNIYRIALADKSIIKLASIGKPPVRDDFEGIAVAPDATYLATSLGKIYRIKPLDLTLPKQVITADVISTDLYKHCEIEGLHYLEGMLLMPCKNALVKTYEGRLVVFGYDIASGKSSVVLSIPRKQIPGLKKLRLTALDASPSDYYIVSANRLVMINRETLAARTFKLPKKYHRQVEGLALLPDGSIILVEDNSQGKARLTHYKDISELEEKTNQSP